MIIRATCKERLESIKKSLEEARDSFLRIDACDDEIYREFYNQVVNALEF